MRVGSGGSRSFSDEGAVGLRRRDEIDDPTRDRFGGVSQFRPSANQETGSKDEYEAKIQGKYPQPSYLSSS